MRRSFPSLPAIVAALIALTACTDPETLSREPALPAPPGAPAGTCWDRHVSPAMIETVTVHGLVSPAKVDDSGKVLQPAVFRTETRQNIVRPRRESWLQITCPVDMTPDFIASLQRALTVRGDHNGAVTGTMDRQTRQAILRYQRRTGVESQLLTIESARQLGLIAVEK